MEENTINIEEIQTEQDSSPVADLAEQKEEQTADKKTDKKRISKSLHNPEQVETRAARNTSYINKKEQEYKKAQHEGSVRAGVTWNQVRSQINSGLYLGLTTEQVEKYATFYYSYEQMEIIKFALYDETPEELLKELINPKLLTKEMLLIKSNSTLVRRITELFLRQDAYLGDIEKLRRDLAEKTAETEAVKSAAAELEAKLAASESRVKELSIKKHLPETGSVKEPVQDRPAAVETVADILENLEEPEKKSKSGGWKRFFHKPEEPILTGKKLPKEVDLQSYIAKAELAPEQMQILNYMVSHPEHFTDGDIKDMIDSGLPADRMKTLLEFKLTKDAAASGER